MEPIFFHVFSFFTIACAIGVVFTRNTVASALCLLLCLTGVAGLFVLLDAFLLAVLLVLVYAGAVVALFLFIVMLLDTSGGARKPFNKATVVASMIGGALLLTGLFSFARNANIITPDDTGLVPVGATLKSYAEQLFTTYLLPVQVVGFLLLIAMLGVIVLSKKFEGLEDIK